jgi:hypothetical protein
METLFMTLVNRRVFQELCLILAALFAIFWAILRACVQAITLDEADTYFWFVARSAGYIFYPFSNNHVLNSLLMWITTHAFGTSIITVRAPALLGAIVYIFTCYFLCRSITSQFRLQLCVFICLTYNPFICDFMVAARGYSLADAFLLAAIAVPVWHRVKGEPPLRECCIWASVGLGLSFTANFSFAFADFAAYLGIVSWAIRRRERESVKRVVEWCTLPGLFIALLICGYPLAHWRREDLWWGAHSFGEMTRSLVQSSLYQLDPGFHDSGLYWLMNFLRPALLPVLAALCACQLVVTRLEGAWLQDAGSRWLGRFAATLAAIVALSLVMSGLAFRLEKLPLPLGRTGIYLVPLCTLIAGIIAAAPTRSVVSRWLSRAIAGVLICLACYFLLCIRLTYFREYEWDADVKDIYSVLARLNHTYGVTDVGVAGFYLSPLNYYRVMSKRETFAAFTLVEPESHVDKPVYVMHGLYEKSFVEREKLVVIYTGKTSGVVVAVKPDGAIPAIPVE